MTYGSLFAGIGGIDRGLDRAGMRCLFQVEIDDYCRKVLAKHWPDVPKYSDVPKFCRRACDCKPENEDGEVICPRCGIEFGKCECIGTDQLIDECGIPDLLCGGFPCTDLSVCGKGEGLAGERSGLWFEYLRIIRELLPRYVVIENSTALLVRGIEDVLRGLSQSGYDAEWQVIRASDFALPHRRERLFIVAHSNGLHGTTRMGAEPNRTREIFPRSLQERLPIRVQASDRFVGVDDGIPGGIYGDRGHAIGNAVVPQVATWIGKRIVEHAIGDAGN